MWKTLFISLVMKLVTVCCKLTGDHVCLSEKIFLKNVTEIVPENFTVRNYRWCLNFPPRCSYYTIKQRKTLKIVTKNEKHSVEECCPTFIEKQNRCVSSCPDCKNGICENNQCTCFAGFKGNSCDLDCSSETWGPNCSRLCDCNNGKCDSKTGTCLEDSISIITTVLTTQQTNIDAIQKLTTPNNEPSRNVHNDVKDVTTTSEITTEAYKTASNIYFTTESSQSISKLNSSPDSTPKFTVSTGENHSESIKQSTVFHKQNSDQYTHPATTTESLPSTLYSSTTVTHSKKITNTPQTNIFSGKTFLNGSIATKTGLYIPVEIQYDEIQEIHSNDHNFQKIAAIRTNVSNLKEPYLNRQVSENINRSPTDFTFFGITVLVAVMLAVVILIVNSLIKRRKSNDKRFKNDPNHQVAVFSATIFHTPLPEPPIAEHSVSSNFTPLQNGLYDSMPSKSKSVYNMRSSLTTDNQDYEYDHPPTSNRSTICAISTFERNKNTFQEICVEPIYDEIPQRGCEQTNIMSSPASIYANTCGRTKF